MKSMLAILGLCFVNFFYAQTNSEKRFSAHELSEDLAFLVRTIENIHPNPYHDISKEKFEQLVDSIVHSFRDSMSVAGAWPFFARVMAALNEGHSTISYPGELTQEIQKGAIKIFPVLIREFDGENLIVRYDLSADSVLRTGDRITKINGRSAAELMKYLTSFYGGLGNWRNTQAIRDFAGNLALHNILPPYKVEYLSDERTKNTIIQGITFPELVNKAAELRKRNATMVVEANYTFQRTEKNTGYINFRSMRDLPVFEKFLDSVFSDIKNNPVDGLIIDLRQNGGGNSLLGEKLLTCITNKPFRMGAGSVWKVSDEYKEFIREQSKTNPVYATGSFRNYLDHKTGEMIKGNSNKPSVPGKNPLRYSGKVCVLIGPNTFSSANMLANAIKDYQLATLIGEPSGEPANDYGELYWSKLPHTQLGFNTCVKQFIRANGDAKDPDPILPDIEIKQNSASLKDEVLEFAKEWVRKK